MESASSMGTMPYADQEAFAKLFEESKFQGSEIFLQLEQVIAKQDGRLKSLQQCFTQLAAQQRKHQDAMAAQAQELARERARRRAAEDALLSCEEDRDEFKSEVIDLKVELKASQCRLEEERVRRAASKEGPPRGIPSRGACRQQIPHGSKRYEDIIGMLHFIGENISLDRCSAMELQGRLVLHDDIVNLGRVLQWKLDFKGLDKLFISIPAEDADDFIAVVKRVIQSQRQNRANEANAPDSSAVLPPLDAETIGHIAAQWRVINDSTVEGAPPTIYILNELQRRAIIIGDWPMSPFSPDSKAIDFSALYRTYKSPDAAHTRRVADLCSFVTFLAENISLSGSVLFEPARSQILLQDRSTYLIHLGRFRRYRLNAGTYEGLFVSVPEEDVGVFEVALLRVLSQEATAAAVAQELGLRWRALTPVQHSHRTYVLNEAFHRVIILDSWPDDSVLAYYTTTTRLVSYHHEMVSDEPSSTGAPNHFPQADAAPSPPPPRNPLGDAESSSTEFSSRPSHAIEEPQPTDRLAK